MSFEPHPAPSATAFASPSPDPQARDAAYLRYLHEMLEIGAGLLRMVHQQADARVAAARSELPPCPAPADDLTIAYERTTRSMRRSIMLAKKLEEPPAALSNPTRIAARKRVIREVEDAIAGNADGAEAEGLQAELLERLDSPDLDDEIANRTIPEIVTDMCRDFGIAGLYSTHPWRRRTPHDIAVLCARAARLAVPAAAKVNQVAQQRSQQAERDPAEPRAAQSTAQGHQQADTG